LVISIKSFLILFVCCLITTGSQANEVDGTALLCKSSSSVASHPIFGLTFENGKVFRFEVNGFSISRKLGYPYTLVGTERVNWRNNFGNQDCVNRKTLKTCWEIQCSISTNEEITQKLNEIITTAKKKNKF